MDKLKMQSRDLVEDNIDRIESLFPNVVTESRDNKGNLIKAVDFDRLKQELSDNVVEGEKERYQLTWPGKKKAMLMANLPTTNTLRPVKEDSVDWDTTGNLFIEGDNLEALKILQESYLNKVKCIYIDPPYNTGKDFIYKDDFKQSRQEYLDQSGQVDEEGNRLFQNNESNGRFHSDWLSMMYPRLKLARNLLREDGVIFISIDDNEIHNLRKICDEIFGEGNFVAEFVWNGKSGSEDDGDIRNNHEYLVCFSKSNSNFTVGLDIKDEESFPLYDKNKKDYYKRQLLRKWGDNSKREDRPNLYYPIKAANGSEFYPKLPDGSDGCWRWGKEKMQKAISESVVEFDTNRSGKIEAYEKIFQSDTNRRKKKFQSLLLDASSTSMGTKETKVLFDGLKVFDRPKPTKYIKLLLKIAKTHSNDIILDFFAGSCTTAHAVIQLNAEDQGKRKYIMVQLPEPCPPDSEAHKAGYKNIAEIGKERIRRAAGKIKEETGADIDYGFRVFRVDSSNMKDVYHHPNEITQDGLQAFETNIKKGRLAEDLLTQVMLDSGLQPSLPMKKRNVQGKDVYFVAGNSLVACFDRDIPEELIREVAKEKPLRVVFQDKSFKDDAARINVDELFKTLSPGTEVKVI